MTDTASGVTELSLNLAFDFKELGGEALVVDTDQVLKYTGFDPETQILYLDATTPLGASAEEGTKIEVLPLSVEKRCFVDTGEGFEPIDVRVPHNMQAVLQDGIRSEASGYESVAIESDGSEWVLKEIYGTPAVINTDALPPIPSELLSDGIAPTDSPAATVAPFGVGGLQGTWAPATQPDLHDPVVYDVYVSATTPVVADAAHFLLSTSGTSAVFSSVSDELGGKVSLSPTQASYLAVWARDSDGPAPTLGTEGGAIPRKADIQELNAEQLNARTIETINLWAGAVQADVVFADNKIIVGPQDASHIVIDPAQGLILYGTDGVTEIVRLDMTPDQISVFTGKIITDELAVLDSLELNGILSRLMSGAIMTIASAVLSPPTSPPTVTQGTNTVPWSAPDVGFTETGLWWDGTDWWRLSYNASTFVAQVKQISTAGTVLSTTQLVNESQDRDARGFAIIGSDWYVLRKDNAAAGSGKWYLKKYNNDGSTFTNLAGNPTLTWNAAFGRYGIFTGSAPSEVRVDASNTIHVLAESQRIIRRFNTSGTFLGQTNLPGSSVLSIGNRFDVDASGNYYFASDTKVVKVDSSGTVSLTFGSYGTGDGQFIGAVGVRLDSSGNIYVVDWLQNRVQKFNASGVFQSKFGTYGSGNGQFDEPNDLDFDSSGNIYVLDSYNNRVQKFDSSGAYLSQFGSYGFTSGLLTEDVFSICIDVSDNVFVGDDYREVTLKFDSSGVFQNEISSAYGSIDSDSSGNVYIASFDVKKYTNSLVFVSNIANNGLPDEALGGPTDAVVDASGDVYVVDETNNRVNKFTSAGVYLSSFGSYGTGDGQFRDPTGIALDPSGNIFVVDSSNHRVQKFNSSGAYVSKFGTSGTGNGQFDYPHRIAINASGDMWVTDGYNYRVQKFNSSGAYVSKFGTSGTGNGQFDSPWGIGLDASGNIYVVDRFNSRVQKFNSSGTYVSKFGTFGSGSGQFNDPKGLAIDANGNIYVTDSYNHRVQKYNSSHTYQLTIGSSGSGDGQYLSPGPEGIAFDPATGTAYVVDRGNKRVQKYLAALPQLSKQVLTEIHATNRPQPTLGYDGSNLLVGITDKTNSTPTDGTLTGGYRYNTSLVYQSRVTLASGDILNNQNATYVSIGNHDYGASRFVIGGTSSVKVYTISGSVLTADTSFPSFTTDGTTKALGWNGSNFYGAADTATLKKYSTFQASTAAARRVWAQYSWGTAGGELIPSPKNNLDLLDRRWVNVTIPTPTTGLDRTWIYLGTGTSSPANGSMWSPSTYFSTPGTVQYDVIPTATQNPKTVSDSISGGPGLLKAETGSFSVNGDSAGAWHERQATPRFAGYLTSNVSVANTGSTTILWLNNVTHSSASAGYWSYNSGTGELTINKTGFWRFEGNITWNANTTAASERQLKLQNTSGPTTLAENRTTFGNRVTNVIIRTLYITAGTVLNTVAEQSSSGSLLIRGADTGACWFNAVYEGPT